MWFPFHTHTTYCMCVCTCACVFCVVCVNRMCTCVRCYCLCIYLQRHICAGVVKLTKTDQTLYFLFFFCLSLSPSLFITLCQQLPWKLFCSSSLHSWCVWLVSAPLLNETQTHVGAHKHTDVHTRGNCPWGGSVGAGSDVTWKGTHWVWARSKTSITTLGLYVWAS